MARAPPATRAFLQRPPSSSPLLLLLPLLLSLLVPTLALGNSEAYTRVTLPSDLEADVADRPSGSATLSVSLRGLSSILARRLLKSDDESDSSSDDEEDSSTPTSFEPCDSDMTDYTPCQDPKRSLKFPRLNMQHRERHCPEPENLPTCLVPPPVGYKYPLPWPKSRDEAWYVNVPHKYLTTEKAVQNWIRYEESTEKFIFPGGGTMFANGADAYIDDLAKLIPLEDGSIRTALDTGCGVASFGGYLLRRGVLTMSFAPRDGHEAQVQFALERGIPAMIGVMATQRLPYPARAFDLAHCSRCLIPWDSNNGLYLAEVDRVLRPGGYWVLSGPPIHWKKLYKGWDRSKEELQAEQQRIEDIAAALCWTKVVEQGIFAVWQKPLTMECLKGRDADSVPPLCTIGSDPDAAWNEPLKPCITRLPAEDDGVAGGRVPKWPERLTAVPPRISMETVAGLTPEKFAGDGRKWAKRIKVYKEKLPGLAKSKYRNVLDMNAEVGGFAASLAEDPVWVMNVVPVSNPRDTLGVIYERGLIGTYQNWCEPFSSYPRTYDLLHVHELFTTMDEKCPLHIVMLEMDRLLRPEGAVIIRDDKPILKRLKKIAKAMRWDARLEDSESPKDSILICVKKYWTSG